MRSQFEGVDAVLIRAAAYPDGLTLPPWPDLTDDDPGVALAWLRLVWPMEGVARVVELASPDLACALARLHDGSVPVRPRQVRRTVEALIRYLLRWTSRSTPFGEFAGVAPVELAEHASVHWGGRHTVVERPDAHWLAELISDLEFQPHILQHVPVVANNLGFLRGAEWIVPCQPTGDGQFADVSISYSPAVRTVLAETRGPIVFGALLAKLSADSPGAPTEAIEAMLTELVGLGVLVSGLRPPMTVTDPHAHIATQVDGLPGAADRLELGERLAVDLRLDCSVTLPPAVMRAAEQAASVLAVLGSERPVWQAYHAAFLERYGPGAVVAVREVADPDIGIGYPADYRGSATRPTRQLLRRDVTLAALAQEAALEGRTEVILDGRLLADLAWPTPAAVAPHTELRFALHAATPVDLDAGNFTLRVVSASRHAGTTVGRFLYLLEPDERDQIIKAYQDLPTTVPGAVTVQLSCPPLAARTGNLARVSAVFPVLSLGEYRDASETPIGVDDLAVTADAHRLYLVSTSTGQFIEPVMLNVIDLRHGTQPIARLLCEISTGRSMPCRPFSWGGVADRFAFLPRLRHGRVILSPARWNLTADRDQTSSNVVYE